MFNHQNITIMLQVEIIGRLGSNAELKSYDGREFVKFNVAHTDAFTQQDGSRKETTTWVSCTINGRAENLLPYLVSGTQVFVRGNVWLRVYSSEKDRCMKAGLNVHVREVELLGSRPDDVPRRLVDKDGVLVEVNKAYYVDPKIAAGNPTLTDERFNVYDVDKHGFVFKRKEQ